MAKDIWEDEETEFRDVPDEVAQPQSAPQVAVPPSRPGPQRPTQPVAKPTKTYEEQEEEGIYFVPPDEDGQDDEEDDYNTSVLSDARLRLEQGRLYEMIMNHDLFQGMEADPQAIKNVQKEIKRFARERMEVMLGMRQTQATPTLSGGGNAVFNDLEIEILKRLASTATNGATETPEANQIAATKIRRTGLAPLGGTTAPRRAPVTVAKSLPKAPQRPVRKKTDPTVDAILREEGIDRDTFEEVTRSTLKKPIEKMTAEELIEHNRQSGRRLSKTVDNPQKLPMATPEQAEMLAAAHAATIQANPGMSAIINKLKSIPSNT